MQLSQNGFSSNSNILERLRDEFLRTQCVTVSEFLPNTLAQQIGQEVGSAEFNEHKNLRSNGVILDTEMTIEGSNIWVHALQLLLNNHELFEAIEYITGCSGVRCFRGRISHHVPGSNHHSDWHNDRDLGGARLIGISINLSTSPYSGGRFELRRTGSRELLASVSHEKPGAAHIFAIRDDLKHRVTATQGTVTRAALAGWFQSSPSSWDVLRKQYSEPAYSSDGRTSEPVAIIPSAIPDTIRVPDFVVSQTFGDAIVLLNMKTRKYYSLNGFAAQLWRMLSRCSALLDIKEQLSDRYPTDRGRAHTGLDSFVSHLMKHELLIAEDPARVPVH
jgi:hypothetical protein